jgi:hypothetical protein
MTCLKEAVVRKQAHRWTIKCVHIEHSMCRTYGINREYAFDRALAHTKKYGNKHLCMVYQRADFDGTMEIAFPNPGQTVIELDEEYREIKGMDSVKKALGIIQEVFPETEEIPY